MSYRLSPFLPNPCGNTEFLRDIENNKYLLVSHLPGKQAAVYEADWMGKPLNAGKHKVVKGGQLKDIVARAGYDAEDIPENALLATHSPPFHADDLVATALMVRYFQSQGRPVTLAFTRDPEVIGEADAVVDVGDVHDERFLRFDHHQDKDAPKAATGLVADFLEKQPGFEWVARIRPALDKIDSADLGETRPGATSMLLSGFNPTWEEIKSGENPGQKCLERALAVVDAALEEAASANALRPEEDPSEVFERAVLQNHDVAERNRETSASLARGRTQFMKAALDPTAKASGVVETHAGIDFPELFSRENLEKMPEEERAALNEINFVVTPAENGGLSAVAVPTPENPMKPKHPFPEGWRGRRGQSLVEAIGKTLGKNLPAAVGRTGDYFCHASGFFLTLPDKETFAATLAYCARAANLGKQKAWAAPILSGVSKKEQQQKVAAADRWGRGGPGPIFGG